MHAHREFNAKQRKYIQQPSQSNAHAYVPNVKERNEEERKSGMAGTENGKYYFTREKK